MRITVELAPGREGEPVARQLPDVVLLPTGDPGYFPVGVKHRYGRETMS
jgi:phenylacetate-CoA ligase